MCCKYDNPVLLVALKHIPEPPPGIEIHSACWLIKYYKLAVRHQGKSHTELPLVTSRKTVGHGVSVGPDVDIFHYFVYFTIFFRGIQPLEVTVDIEMLSHRELIKKDVVLGANADDLLNELDVILQVLGRNSIVNQVFAEARDIATCGLQHARQHRDGGGLASTVVPE